MRGSSSAAVDSLVERLAQSSGVASKRWSRRLESAPRSSSRRVKLDVPVYRAVVHCGLPCLFDRGIAAPVGVHVEAELGQQIGALLSVTEFAEC
jgi:hypothetical protein